MNNIISCNIEKNDYSYRLGVLTSIGSVEDILVTADGIYTVCYENTTGKLVTESGKITKVISNPSKLDSYIEFDNSYDNSNRHKRIYFNKIKSIKDVTPNNAYVIAVKHGFIGTEEEWINKMRYGKSAYEVAVDNGFIGTEEEWLFSIRPVRGVDYYTEDDIEDLKNDITDKVNDIVGDIHDDIKAKQELAAESEANALNFANEAKRYKEAAESAAIDSKDYANAAGSYKNIAAEQASIALNNASDTKRYMDKTEEAYTKAAELLEDINAKHTDIVNDITDIHSTAVDDINSKHSNAIADISSKSEESIANITDIHNQAVTSINSNYDEHINAIKSNAETALSDISKKRAKVLSDVENKTESCLVELDNKTSECISNVEDKKDDFIIDMQDKKDGLIVDIEDKSKEVISDLESKGAEILEGVVNATNVYIPQKGIDYFDGVSGVYVGSGEMPEEYNVQIDPDDTGADANIDDIIDGLLRFENTIKTNKLITPAIKDFMITIFRNATYSNDQSANIDGLLAELESTSAPYNTSSYALTSDYSGSESTEDIISTLVSNVNNLIEEINAIKKFIGMPE